MCGDGKCQERGGSVAVSSGVIANMHSYPQRTHTQTKVTSLGGGTETACIFSPSSRHRVDNPSSPLPPPCLFISCPLPWLPGCRPPIKGTPATLQTPWHRVELLPADYQRALENRRVLSAATASPRALQGSTQISTSARTPPPPPVVAKMDPASRVRVMNVTVLTCILVLYIAHDAGFRFWMTRSDTLPLTAALVHDTKVLQQYGDVGLAYDAAIGHVRTRPLQLYTVDAERFAANYTARMKATAAEAASQNDVPRPSPTPSAADDTFSDALPMAAVVVESTWLTPDQDAVSSVYAQRLLQGYRYALLSGAPWLLLSGSATEASVGLQFLRLLPNPAERIFPDSVLEQWPPPLVTAALQLRESMAPYETLGAWVHGAGTRPLKSFPASSMTSLASQQQDTHQSSVLGDSSLQSSLSQLLSAHSLTETGVSHVRPAALILGAEWMRHMDAQHRSGSPATNVNGATEAAADGHAAPEQPRVTVYATMPDTDDGDDDLTMERNDDGGAAKDAASAPWEQPRVLELHVNSTSTAVHVTVPGMVMISDVNINRRAQNVARAVQQLVELALVHRHATRSSSAPTDTEREAGWWWWIARPYGVTVVAGRWEQQRVKLLYMKAFREAVADSQEGLRKAVQLLHQSRCQFERPLLPLSCHGVRGPQLPPSALPFSTAVVPARSRIFVLPPPYEDLQSAQPKPEWLNYTGELPASINAEASCVAKLLGRLSFFLYFNYRRWMDWFLASLPVGSYQDHFVLISVLMSDFAEHRISWMDVLHLR
ncbi:conserved hypothetical protein [Leishmania mexicana MHOM/GT/2001/U1103]|uniref:Uncharacterized protein n=1 Tax=Leishmania mexicana (strain MHOM/GT/2001/U1103) TaxID=929439 RepID=E9AWM9_LEIMU|nr:conserved hypothetical protein [Leishmania mexicana MHOM/GT/2001/U1103]CBZ27365.1 conserved hypothetical protein [Leishmania mexicana MHOM/GT/2001/U1103]